MSLFNTSGYTIENAWTPAGEPEKLSKEEKDSIKEILVKDSQVSGKTVKNFVFFFKEAGVKPKSFAMSPYMEQYPAGTRIRISSVSLQELTNDAGESITRVSGEMA